MTDTINTAPSSEQQKDWTPSSTGFAVIIDGQTGKQIADFASPHLSEEECTANLTLALAAQYMLATLQRAEFLMRRVGEGDHQALEKLADGAAQCRDAICLAIGRAA